MEFGLFSNGQRLNQIARISYDDDLREVILADELGMKEAWISEHGTLIGFQAPDQLPCADLFICKAAALTKQIKMGPGIRALAFYHPLQVATEAAVCDHLTNGRYMAGFGVGLGGTKGNQRGKLPASARAMMRESIDIILKAWEAKEPFDWRGEIWQGDQWHIIPQPEHELEVGIACSRSEGTLELAAELSFHPIMSWTGTVDHVRDMIPVYMGAKNKRGLPPKRSRVRVARFIYVSDSVEQAKQELHGADLGGALAGGRLDHFLAPGDTRDQLSIEYLIDRGIFFCGDPERVYQQIKGFYDTVGGFGLLLMVVGKDWATRELRARSMRRFMAEVAPRLAALTPD